MNDDDNSSTRPISVAELLAKNGTIGAPPVGGRRRRRRGNSDAVTVAELTGEIPIITDDAATTGRTPVQAHRESHVRKLDEPPAAPAVDELVEEPTPIEAPVEEPVAEPAEQPVDDAVVEELALEPDSDPEPVLTDEEADYAAHLQQREADPDPIDFAPPTRRSQAVKSTSFATQAGGAEQMSPDPVVDDDDLEDLGPDVDFTEVLDKHSSTDEDATASEDVPSYLRSSSGTLFGGESVADDLARRGPQPGPEDIDLGDVEAESAQKTREPSAEGGSAFVRGVWVVAQCILAVAFGAGLFIAFDQLWRWNTIVALVLSVLVILGLVVGVRVVRKTEDIGSTLIAVAVGALVTLGPLALLQSH
jgi:hypothetical protein